MNNSSLPGGRLLAKISASLQRDADLPLTQKLWKGLRFVAATAAAPLYLAACNRVGARARAQGRPIITNEGRIEIGDDFNLNSSFSPSALTTHPGAVLRLGDRVTVNFGTSITAHQSVQIGDRVGIGPYSIISDAEAPGTAARPVTIGDDVWLAGRVTVLPGATIGEGSVITAGSIVSGAIPPGVIAGGNPARVLRKVHVDSQTPAQYIPAKQGPPEPRPAPTHRAVIISDFTAYELAQRLAAADELPLVESEVAPFGQVVPSLVELASREDRPDVAIVWTRPEAVLPSFAELRGYHAVPLDKILEEVDAYVDLLVNAANGARTVLVPTWVMPPFERGLGMIDLKHDAGVSRALLHANVRLSEKLRQTPNVHVLGHERWVMSAGRAAFNPKLWYLGKIPFSADVFVEAARDVKAALRGLSGGARKLVVVDLDDTLWGGIVGDAGWQNLKLGGHDSVGEAFVDFQRALKALTRRGIVLAIVSKNEESVALEAIRSHPEMVLRADDFVTHRINWKDKAQNIADLAAEIGLGLQSVVFIDDNPVERARVREALPEVLVPEWPEDKVLYTSALKQLRCFDAPSLSKEDQERTQLYASERKRDELRRTVGSVDEWLRTLDIRVRAEPISRSNLQRTAQLFNKTNQMNLATRRLTEAELWDWCAQPGRRLWAVSVADRFGDAGLTGIVSVERDGPTARIVDFILSCRVMGRRVEDTLVHLAVEHARAIGATLVEARYLPTAKNKPCLDFWRGSSFTESDQVFRWDTAKPYARPDVVTLEVTS